MNDLLKSTSDMHASQQGIRVSRQVEKSRSQLHQLPDTIHRMPTPVADEETKRQAHVIASLPQQQLTQLENENHALLDELEVTLNSVKAAEKSLSEISHIQTELATHLSIHNDMIKNLLDEAQETHGDVSMANEQLDSARKRNRVASKMIIWVSLVSAIILLFYDWLLP